MYNQSGIIKENLVGVQTHGDVSVLYDDQGLLPVGAPHVQYPKEVRPLLVSCIQSIHDTVMHPPAPASQKGQHQKFHLPYAIVATDNSCSLINGGSIRSLMHDAGCPAVYKVYVPDAELMHHIQRMHSHCAMGVPQQCRRISISHQPQSHTMQEYDGMVHCLLRLAPRKTAPIPCPLHQPIRLHESEYPF